MNLIVTVKNDAELREAMESRGRRPMLLLKGRNVPCKVLEEEIAFKLQAAKKYGLLENIILIKANKASVPETCRQFNASHNHPNNVVFMERNENGYIKRFTSYEPAGGELNTTKDSTQLLVFLKDYYSDPTAESVKNIDETEFEEMRRLLLAQPAAMEPEKVGVKYLTQVRRFTLKEDCLPVITEHGHGEYLSPWGNRPSSGQLNSMSEFGLKGDILEELFNKPGHFINVSKARREIDKNMGNMNSQIISYDFEKGKYRTFKALDVYKYHKHLTINLEPDLSEIRPGEFQMMKHLVNTKKVLLNLEAIEPIETSQSLQLTDLKYCSKKLGGIYSRKIKSQARINEELTNLRAIMQIEEEND